MKVEVRRKIGFIDSGIGGLSLLHEFLLQNLNIEVFYISDEANVPYGGREQSFMLLRTNMMVEQLIAKGANDIVLACNTLTAETIDVLRKSYEKVNFIGVEPYVNYLNKESSQSEEKVGIILTLATSKSNRFLDLLAKYDPEQLIHVFPLTSLALIIEELKYSSIDEVKDKLIDELKLVKDAKLDKLILGCTHYPLIKSFLENELNISTVNPHQYVVDQILNVLGPIDISKKTGEFHYNKNLSKDWELKHIEWISNTFDL